MAPSYPFRPYEKYTDQIRAVQITQDNYRHICRTLLCEKVEVTIVSDALDDDVVSYKFLTADGTVKHVFQDRDYLILGETKEANVEVVKPYDFEKTFHEPLIHLSPNEYDEFKKMRADWYKTSRPKGN